MSRHAIRACAAIGLALAAAAPARAQQTSVSVVPVAGYVLPSGNFTEDALLTLEPKGGIFVGATAELSLGKNLSLGVEASRTLGNTQELDAVIGGASPITLTTDMATTMLSAMVILRPLGRLPSGAPRTLYLEAGVGMARYDVSLGLQDPDDPNALDFTSTSPYALAGVGLSFPAGPRFSIQLWARGAYQFSEYSSDALDDINALVGANIQGERTLLLSGGLGLRIGR